MITVQILQKSNKDKRFSQIIRQTIKFIASQNMQAQKIYSVVGSMNSKQTSQQIDPQKIRIILSKKLQGEIANPEQMVQQLDKEISYQIKKAEFQIGKEKLRQEKIKLIEERQLKARSLLKQKIQSKLRRSENKKITQQKNSIQKMINARKLKEEFFEDRRQQICQTEFKKRLQLFKQIKAQNQQKQPSFQQTSTKSQTFSLLKRSSSQRSSRANPIQKSKQLKELQYFKRLQLVEKRKVYEKPQLKMPISQLSDKKIQIEKINSQSQKKSIQKLGQDLLKIDQARKRKQIETDSRVQKMKKQADLRQEQRLYRIQLLKQDFHQTQKNIKQNLNKKNQRFLTTRNNSTPKLLPNLSYTSQNQDQFGLSTTKKFLESTNKMSKTLETFNHSLSLQRAKAQDYLVKLRDQKIKLEAVNIVEKVLRDQKIGLLKK